MGSLSKELNLFFEPTPLKAELERVLPFDDTLASQLKFFSEEEDWCSLKNYSVAVIGIEEERGTSNKGTAEAANTMRPYLTQLAKIDGLKIADLGNFKIGETLKDTYEGLALVIKELLASNILPVLVGGGNDLTFAMQKAWSEDEKINLCLIDPRLDIVSDKESLNAYNYLNYMLIENIEQVFNVTNIGLQSYYNSSRASYLFDDLYFDYIRLGTARNDLKALEPCLRDSDFISLDVAAIKQSDCPGHKSPSVNGFYSEEICQLAKYAGLSDRLKCFGLFEYNPAYDKEQKSAALSAQIIWHLLEGVSQREKDYPLRELKHYAKFIVQIEDVGGELVFYKNKANGRWWLEVPFEKKGKAFKKVVACSENDYQQAAQNQIPDLWWNTLQKIKHRIH